MKFSHGTWVLVVDGEKFLLLRNEGDRGIMDLRVIDHDEIRNPPTREQGSERPGRMPDAGAPGRSAVEQTDWHALEKERFAHDMADRLRGWALDNRFDALFVCAAPRTLGAMRPEYHVEVVQRLVGELDKDLTGMPVDRIQKVLEAA
jgi:protein required for attachment to host cells